MEWMMVEEMEVPKVQLMDEQKGSMKTVELKAKMKEDW